MPRHAIRTRSKEPPSFPSRTEVSPSADYYIDKLPSVALGENPKDSLPVCDTSHPCVLYVGEDWNDFSKPKVFSAPFTVTSSGSGAGS